MTEGSTSSDIKTVLKELSQLDQAEPGQFERVARWRRACGDAEAAATWQTWSLLPPEPEELRSALADLWRRVGDTDAAAGMLAAAGRTKSQKSWQQLALLLEQADLEAASNLQQQLLLDPPVLAIPELVPPKRTAVGEPCWFGTAAETKKIEGMHLVLTCQHWNVVAPVVGRSAKAMHQQHGGSRFRLGRRLRLFRHLAKTMHRMVLKLPPGLTHHAHPVGRRC
jgi:hypothetical protein